MPLLLLKDRLADRTARGSLVEDGPRGALRCVACAHRCVLTRDGAHGVCGVRFRRGDELRVPWGYVARRHVRPVETNTVFHVLPGARALTFGMYGCDLRCPYCQNWKVSQALREGVTDEGPRDVTPRELVDEALRAGCEVVCSAYNEPLITAEWAHAIFTEAKRSGLVTVLVSDGHGTPQVLEYLRPVCDVLRVDLKAFDEPSYRRLGGRLAPVLDTIALGRSLGYWMEIVTLVAAGLNDELRTARDVAGALARLSPDMPWHLNAAQPRYRWKEDPVDAQLLVSMAGAAYAQGLRHVYVGNVALQELAHTRCPECRHVLVRRSHFATTGREDVAGACSRCGAVLPGIWSAQK